MGGIDEGGIGGEAVELLRDLLENSDGGIDRRRRLEEEIGLNVEGREDRRVKTCLYRPLDGIHETERYSQRRAWCLSPRYTA